MLFNSIDFLIFFPIVVLLFFYTPQRFRWVLLLVASYYFYMSWEPAYALLIITSTIIDYWASHKIQISKSQRNRNIWLFLSLLTNFGLLFSFKYYNFFSESLSWISLYFPSPLSLPKVNWLLPVGISFYTFQTVSYTIEVYRGKQKAEDHFGYFALYVSFFPQLVAGPIERPANLLPQFRQEHSFEYERVTNALKLMAWGMFKKVVVADRLAFFVDPVYNDPASFSGPILCVATFFFAIQIYCDFSGYSDIAIGAAGVLGIKLMRNFNSPYLATSVVDFWRRWHISLSTWFRDYLYFPLGGNKVSKKRWQINILIVFLVSGLWHGANWTFVIWGAIHGLFFVIHNISKPIRKFLESCLQLNRIPKMYKTFQIICTFLIVCFAWIFFRANNMSDAIYIVSNLATGWSSLLDRAIISDNIYSILGINSLRLIVALGFVWITIIVLMVIIEFYEKPRQMFVNWPWWTRWPSYFMILLAMLFLGAYEQSAFIYFQF